LGLEAIHGAPRAEAASAALDAMKLIGLPLRNITAKWQLPAQQHFSD
jgi:hypothetical protein